MFYLAIFPELLVKWQDKTNSGDYFDQIKSTKVGYLIWSTFPVKVKVEIPTGINEKQSQVWVNSVLQAIQNTTLNGDKNQKKPIVTPGGAECGF